MARQGCGAHDRGRMVLGASRHLGKSSARLAGKVPNRRGKRPSKTNRKLCDRYQQTSTRDKSQKSEALEIMDKRSKARRFPILLFAAIAALVTGSPGSAAVLNNLLMRASLTLLAIAILLCPDWSSTGLLRAQGLIASRNSSGPRVVGPSAGSNTQPRVAAGSALGDKA